MAIWTLLTQDGCAKKKYPQQKFAEFHSKRLHAYEFHKSRIKHDHTFCRPNLGDFCFSFWETRPFCGPIPISSIPEKKTPIYYISFVTKQQPSPYFKATPVSSESECTCSVCFLSCHVLCSQIFIGSSLSRRTSMEKSSSKIPSTPTS